ARPAEAFGASRVALAQRLARERPAALRIALGIVPQPDVDRIDRQLAGELVDRGLEAEGARRLAGPAIERRRAEIQAHQPLAGLDIGYVVQHPRLERGRLDPVLERRRARDDVLPDGGDPAVVLRPEAQVLDSVGTRADRTEHLPAGEDDPYRPLQMARGDRGQHHVRPRRALRSEGAADEFRDDADMVLNAPQGRGDEGLGAV